MKPLKRNNRVEKKCNLLNLYRYLSGIFLSLALMAVLNLVKIFSDKILPILSGLTLKEANSECDLLKIEERWDYQGGFQDCVIYYTSDHLIAAELLYNISSISLSSVLIILFTICGFLMLRFSR